MSKILDLNNFSGVRLQNVACAIDLVLVKRQNVSRRIILILFYLSGRMYCGSIKRNKLYFEDPDCQRFLPLAIQRGRDHPTFQQVLDL